MASELPSTEWVTAAPASTEDVERLNRTVPGLPTEYFDLLRKTNGGEGPLEVHPGWFQLFDVTFALQTWHDTFYREQFPELFFFGSNGGLESLALALAGPNAGSVLAVDAIAGVGSALLVSTSFRAFAQHIGKSARSEA